ncbi:unnamed protein product [Lepidochelys olivacea]
MSPPPPPVQLPEAGSVYPNKGANRPFCLRCVTPESRPPFARQNLRANRTSTGHYGAAPTGQGRDPALALPPHLPALTHQPPLPSQRPGENPGVRAPSPHLRSNPPAPAPLPGPGENPGVLAPSPPALTHHPSLPPWSLERTQVSWLPAPLWLPLGSGLGEGGGSWFHAPPGGRPRLWPGLGSRGPGPLCPALSGLAAAGAGGDNGLVGDGAGWWRSECGGVKTGLARDGFAPDSL